jgi:single-strand DNA-binding protein
MKKRYGKGAIEHMGSVNKVILVGNLTRNPEMKQTEGKKPTCTFGLAANRHWTDERGEKHEEPGYHRIVAWDKLSSQPKVT